MLTLEALKTHELSPRGCLLRRVYLLTLSIPPLFQIPYLDVWKIRVRKENEKQNK